MISRRFFLSPRGGSDLLLIAAGEKVCYNWLINHVNVANLSSCFRGVFFFFFLGGNFADWWIYHGQLSLGLDAGP